jgi:hypothetical protein
MVCKPPLPVNDDSITEPVTQQHGGKYSDSQKRDVSTLNSSSVQTLQETFCVRSQKDDKLPNFPENLGALIPDDSVQKTGDYLQSTVSSIKSNTIAG